MRTLPPTVFAGAFCLIIATRFLAVGNAPPEYAALMGVGLLLVVHARSLWNAFRKLPSLLQGLLAAVAISLATLLGARSLDLTTSGTTVSEEKDLTSVLH